MTRMLLTLGLLLAALPEGAVAEPLPRYTYSERHMGIPWKLIVYAAEEQTANMAAKAVFAKIAALNKIMSDYDPTSELMQLCLNQTPGEPNKVSPDLFAVLEASQKLAKRTDGAFDVTVGPLTKLWRRTKRRGELPPERILKNALAVVGYENLMLDEQAQTVTFRKAHVLIDLGGIAAGYAADAGMKILKNHGIDRALIDASGDVLVSAPPPNEEAWTIGVGPLKPDAPPSVRLPLKHQAVANSGDAFQYVEIDRVRYSHIVDPQTGLGLTTRSSVTVIADTCMDADSLASAVSILGPKKGLELIQNTPGTAALIVRVEDGELRRYTSQRWEAFATATQ